MTWQTFAFILIAGAALGYSGHKFYVLWELMQAQQGKGPKITDIPRRIQTTIINVLGQKAVLEKPSAGIMHATIFWGFIIITIGTLEQFAATLYDKANFEFIGHGAYSGLIFTQDLFTGLILLAVLYAFYRRLVIAPPGLGKSRDALWVLTFTVGSCLDPDDERVSRARHYALVLGFIRVL